MPDHASYSDFKPCSTREETLQYLIDSYVALATDLRNWVSNLANCASLIWHAYHSLGVNVNWTGFYVKDPSKQQYLLGPFQGKVACQVIESGTGVCGTAASRMESILVNNVLEFPGHIACDGGTRSEIVVPIIFNGSVVALIDLDCLDFDGFSSTDQRYLELLASALSKSCDWFMNSTTCQL